MNEQTESEKDTLSIAINGLQVDIEFKCAANTLIVETVRNMLLKNYQEKVE